VVFVVTEGEKRTGWPRKWFCNLYTSIMLLLLLLLLLLLIFKSW
jgi:hypothetical protein